MGKSTQDAFIKSKLSATAVPDWKAGWKRLEPALEDVPPKRSPLIGNWRRLSAVAALVAALVTSVWWVDSMRPENPPVSGESSSPIVVQHARRAPAPSPLPSINLTSPSALTGGSVREPRDRQDASVPVLVDGGHLDKETSRSGNLPLAGASGIAFLPPAAIVRRSAPLLAAPLSGNEGDVPVWLKQEPVFSPPLADASASTPPPKKSGGVLKGVALSVGLSANGGSSFGNASSNYNPLLKGSPVDVYPAAFVSRRLGRKISLGVGLALASPVNVQRDALTKSISYPDRAQMAPNVSQSQDYINISRLYYADVPVIVQYHLGTRFSIGSGLQLSVLEKVIGKKQRQDYDAAGVLALALPVRPEPENLTHANSVSGTIRPVDFRWVVGVHYQLGTHWDASLQYQYGLTDISTDKAFLHNNVNRNNVLSAGLNFVIR